MSNTEIRQEGNVPFARANYKTKICKYGKSCHYGDRCFYAHSEQEILPRTLNVGSGACKSTDGTRSTPQRRIISRHSKRYSGDSPGETADPVSLTPEKVDLESETVSIVCPLESCGPVRVLCNLSSLSSCESRFNESGPTTPVSGGPSIDSWGSPLIYINYLQIQYSSKELEAILTAAAPPFYTE